MKRLIIIILLLFPMITFAGDIPFALMEGHEQAMAIGEIIEHSDETTIKLHVFMMGTYSETITVPKIDRYYMNNQKPKKGDLLVLIIDNDRIDSWLFKVSSTDYRELVLYTEHTNMSDTYQDLINEGAYFKAQIELDEKLGKENLYHAEHLDYLNDKNLPPFWLSLILIASFIYIVYLMFIKK